MSTEVLLLENETDMFNIFGNLDENIKLLENEYGVSIVCRGSEVKITGSEKSVEHCRRVLKRCVECSYGCCCVAVCIGIFYLIVKRLKS